MARHRLARVPYIGVPRQVLVTRMQQRAAGVQPYAPPPEVADFFRYQVGAPQWAAA